MLITVQISEIELLEMETTQDQLRKAVVQTLDGGIDCDDGSTIYLAGFNVDLKIVD
jgi:hypothetical protein